MENRRSEDDEMSRRMWKVVETEVEKVGMSEAKGGKEERRRGEERDEKKKTKKKKKKKPRKMEE